MNMVDRLAAYPRWVALGLGALAACGFEPLGLWPLTLLAVAGLIELTSRAANWKQAAWVGWMFGIGHFTLGNNWIATAFTYQANMPAWLGWIAVVLLSLYLAVYPLLGVVGGWWLGHRFPNSTRAQPLALVLALAGGWIISEWLRSWVFTGFAWNPLGVAALGPFDRPGLAVILPWIGTYALSGVVVLLAGCWWLATKRPARDPLALALLVIPAGLFWLPSFAGPQVDSRLPYTLVQPDVRQEDLNDPRKWEDQFIRTAQLSQAVTVTHRQDGNSVAQGEVRRLVLWPESGVPDYLRDGYPHYLYYQTTYRADPVQSRERIGQAIGSGSLLLTGAVDLEVKGGKPVGAYNVVTAIDSDGQIKASYSKAHLVPYGEYLALRWLLEPLGASRLVAGALDFIPGPGPQTLDLGQWGQAGIQICYEIIFSGQVVDRNHRPDYLVNPSNDGWFGAWGPPQHLAQSRLRAIEEGLPILRATTTGISAVIDGHGVVRRHIPRHVPARLDGMVPAALAPTLFSQMGNMLPLLWATALLVLSLVVRKRRKA